MTFARGYRTLTEKRGRSRLRVAMDVVQPKFNRAMAACVVLTLVLGGFAFWTSASHSAPAPEPAPIAGAKTYAKWCADCHSTPGGPGSMALQRKYQGSLPAILDQRDNLQPQYVNWVVRHGISFMPSFRKTEISDADLALLTAYLASPHAQARPVTKRP